jgi:hypothetical protein
MTDHKQLIADIIDWSLSVENFDVKFVRSLQEWLAKHDKLTSGQEKALLKIAEDWNIASEHNPNFNKKYNKYFDKIDSILEWATENPKFDTKFVDSIKSNMVKFNAITPKQMNAVDTIITKFKI